MILRDVIRYYELTGSDFPSDLKDFAQLQRQYLADIVDENFTDKYEAFTDNLLELWLDRKGGIEKIVKDGLALPTQDELIKLYCRVISPQEEKVEETTFFYSEGSLRAKKNKAETSQTLELLASLANVDMDLSQFLDMELEVVYTIIDLVGKKKKEEQKKRKQKRKGR